VKTRDLRELINSYLKELYLLAKSGKLPKKIQLDRIDQIKDTIKSKFKPFVSHCMVFGRRMSGIKDKEAFRWQVISEQAQEVCQRLHRIEAILNKIDTLHILGNEVERGNAIILLNQIEQELSKLNTNIICPIYKS